MKSLLTSCTVWHYWPGCEMVWQTILLLLSHLFPLTHRNFQGHRHLWKMTRNPQTWVSVLDESTLHFVWAPARRQVTFDIRNTSQYVTYRLTFVISKSATRRLAIYRWSRTLSHTFFPPVCRALHKFLSPLAHSDKYTTNLKVPWNANACWLLLKYISVNITNSSTVP